jgi:hypothetical protein
MKNLVLRNEVRKKVKDSIFITGSARSGTTIMGKIIHSMKDVEYVFEPPTLVSLFSAIDNLQGKDWKLLFETYLYEEFLINALAGRNINLNENDDSSIWHVKSKREINQRLKTSHRKADVTDKAKGRHIAYKLPNMVPYIERFKTYYSAVTIILMVRNPIDTINSLMKKGWFTDDSLSNENRLWPTILYQDQNIPHWVEPSMFEEWINMTEVDRCGYYFLRNFKKDISKSTIMVNYDYFVWNSEFAMKKICSELGLKKGEQSDTILRKIYKRDKNRNKKILEKLNNNIRKKVIEAEKVLSEVTIKNY